MTTNVNPRGADFLRALDHSHCTEGTRATLLPHLEERPQAASGRGKTERRSGRRLPAGVEAHLRGMIGAVDMLGDQLDIARRDGLVALGPCRSLLQQLEVQGRELWAMLPSAPPRDEAP